MFSGLVLGFGLQVVCNRDEAGGPLEARQGSLCMGHVGPITGGLAPSRIKVG